MTGRPLDDISDPKNQDREKFAAQTVHFDLDSSTIKKSEQPKLDVVADYYKANPGRILLIEGHCDERGTEGYNLALGDRRALALREYLVNLGVSPESIHTVSFGEQKPVATGRSEDAYKQNRRGQFILIIGK
ncbi:MAG: OmpA family protein [Opitutaceae bacterium]|nr:OmpA family protein [Verrucomicrobiales bacterium]